MNALSQTYSLRTCTGARAVEHFLVAMRKAADSSFPAWCEVLKSAIGDCALSYDIRRAVFDQHPIDDYYFAAAVGKEAAQLRTLFDVEDATELLAEIAERVDQAAGRTDRLVSSLVFDIISQLELTCGLSHKQPHDEAMSALLRRLAIDTTPETRGLMNDLLFRHHLGEPLAISMPNWWMAFRTNFVLTKAHALTTPVRPALPKSSRRAARSLM